MSVSEEKILKWYSPTKEPFKICGFPFFNIEGVYRRMKLNPPKPIPEMVDIISNETSGGQIRFSAHIKTLKLNVELAKLRSNYPTITRIAACGFDCYVKEDGEYKFFSTSTWIDEGAERYNHILINLEKPKNLDIIINFPLYCGVDKLLIGVDENALIYPPKKFSTDKKLVFYGSSIMQGACASRPGMSVGNILSRWLDIEVINLGFDASGKAEPEMAEAIREIPDTALLLICVEGNCPDEIWLKEKVTEFITIYREKQQKTPIILVPFMPAAKECIMKSLVNTRIKKKIIQSDIVKLYSNSGDENIYFLDAESLCNETFDGHSLSSEYTVDGLHLTDFGFISQAKGLYSLIKNLIKE